MVSCRFLAAVSRRPSYRRRQWGLSGLRVGNGGLNIAGVTADK